MNNHSRLLIPIIAAVAVIAVIFLVRINSGGSGNGMDSPASQELTYFTNFQLKGLDGETFTRDDLKGHKITVINGWAPWCSPCTGEMPDLDALNSEYGNKGLQVIGIVADYYPNHKNGGSDAYDRDIREVITSTKVRYPILVSDEAFYNGPAVTMKNMLPCTWAVDENGHVVEIVHGSRSKDEWRSLFDKWLRSVS